VSVSTDGGTRVGLSAVARIVAERVQNVSVVAKATTLRAGITVVGPTNGRTTSSSVGRTTIGNGGGVDDSDEKSKDYGVKHFGYKCVVDVVVVAKDRNYRN
jgi:hypothetical protein